MPLQPNPEREELRQQLRFIRWRGYKLKKQGSVLRLRENRREEQRISRKLANTAPMIDPLTGKEFWSEGHFKRFRHSARLGQFIKGFIDGRQVWIKKPKV